MYAIRSYYGDGVVLAAPGAHAQVEDALEVVDRFGHLDEVRAGFDVRAAGDADEGRREEAGLTRREGLGVEAAGVGSELA